MPRKLVLIVILLCFALCSFGQDNILFTNYSVDDGLPQSSVIDVVQDKQGFIWVSTPDGCGRFDGYNFHTYKNNPANSFSINSNKGETFYIDKTNRLWIITYRGLCLYDDARDRFIQVINYEPYNIITTASHIYGEDGHYIYASICGYGFVSINKNSLAVTIVNIPGVNERQASYMYYNGFIEDGKIWMCSNTYFNEGYFIIYDIKNNKTDKINIPLSKVVSLNDSEALGYNEKGIELINKKTFSHTLYSLTADSKSPNIAGIYCVSGTEVILCSTTLGVFYFNAHIGKVTRRIAFLGNDDKTNFIYARCLCRDRSGNLWIGTNGDGLKKIRFPFKKFKYHNSFSSKNNLVRSIYADSTHFFLGYYNNGMDMFLRTGGFVKNMPVPSSLLNNAYYIVPYTCNTLLSISSSANHTQGNNIPVTYNVITSKTAIIGKPLETIIPELNYPNYSAQFLYNYKDGNILTGIGGYLIAFGNTGKLMDPQVIHNFHNDILTCAFYDKSNSLWIGSYNGAWHNKSGAWQKVTLPATVEVKTICQDKTGNIWLGTVRGIYIADTLGNIKEHYDENKDLANEHIYGILCDDDGNMWFSHNKGLSVYMVHEKTFRHFTKEDGLQSDEFNAGAYFKARDGELFFGGVNGANSFYPKEILSNPNPPNVKISSIKLFDKLYKTDSAYWNLHVITLPYTDNNLSFEFAALEFTNIKNNRYAYIMEGLDKTWIQSGDQRFARYSTLPPGNYIFKVKAANNDGIWNDNPAMIYIHIIPPFWMSTWFYVLCILFFVGIMAGIFWAIQWQRYKKQLRAIELQTNIQLERERISRDLHDNVGTQLSIISNNLDWITDTEETAWGMEKKEKLSYIRQSAEETISMLRETIWALKKEKITFEEFSDKLKAHVNKQLEIYPHIKVAFRDNEHNEYVILSANEALHLFRICQEVVANTLKHANATTLHISLFVNNGKYEVSITDNGIGFDPGEIDIIANYGIEHIGFRTNEIGCNFEIKSVLGEGTTVSVHKK